VKISQNFVALSPIDLFDEVLNTWLLSLKNALQALEGSHPSSLDKTWQKCLKTSKIAP